MFIYSAIKIKAKGELLYSILNPDTNSDSPSAKSKGVRWVSARIDVIQVIAKGNNIQISQKYWVNKMKDKFIDAGCIMNKIKINDSLTS